MYQCLVPAGPVVSIMSKTPTKTISFVNLKMIFWAITCVKGLTPGLEFKRCKLCGKSLYSSGK